jgi:hypothetical protein
MAIHTKHTHIATKNGNSSASMSTFSSSVFSALFCIFGVEMVVLGLVFYILILIYSYEFEFFSMSIELLDFEFVFVVSVCATLC